MKLCVWRLLCRCRLGWWGSSVSRALYSGYVWVEFWCKRRARKEREGICFQFGRCSSLSVSLSRSFSLRELKALTRKQANILTRWRKPILLSLNFTYTASTNAQRTCPWERVDRKRQRELKMEARCKEKKGRERYLLTGTGRMRI